MKRSIIALILLCLSCQKAARRGVAEAVAIDSTAGGVSRAAVAAPAPPLTPQPSRMIIRNANVTLVVRDAEDALRKIVAVIESKSGYVAESKQWKEREQVRASATVRVPSAQLGQTLAAIRRFAVRVESENVSAEDVSQEYSDLNAQVTNLRATEAELRELLKTVRVRTQKAAEVMEVYSEITKVRGEIDRLIARVQYLSQMTSLSAITVELIPDVLAAPVVEPGWQPLATAKAAARSLLNAMKAVADVAIWVVIYVLPLGVIFAVLALVVRSMWLRLRPVTTRG